MDIQRIVDASPALPSPVRQRPVEPPPPSPALEPIQLEHAVRAVNKFIQSVVGNLEFSIDRETGKTVVKLVDSETRTVLRQIPSEEMLAIARALDKLQGLLIKQQA